MNFNTLKLIVVVTILSLTYTVNGQKINWGPVINGTKDYTPKIIGEDEHSFYTYSISDKAISDNELIIEKFEKTGSKKLYIKQYAVPKHHKAEMAVLTENKILIFFSFYDKDKKLSEIYYNSYSPADGIKIELMHTVSSVHVEQNEFKDWNNSQGGNSKPRGTIYSYDFDNYNLYKSHDNKKILIAHRWYTEKEEKYTTQYILLDQNLNKIVEKEEVINKSEDQTFYISGMTIDQEGSYYLHKNYNKGGYRTVLISYDVNKGFEKYEYKIDTGLLALPANGKIDNSAITFNKNGDIILVGEFLMNEYYLTGCFFIKINPKTKKMIEWKLNKFERKLTDQFLTQKQIKKGKNAVLPGDFRKMHLILKDDGGVIGITDRYTNGQLPDNSGEYFLYGDIMTFNFTPNGTMLWAHRIPRDQSQNYRNPFRPGKELDYFSHFTALSTDKLYIAYNDSPANVLITSDNEDLDRFKMSGKPVIALFTIDLKTGKKDKSQFVEGADLETNPEPKSAFQKSQNSELIILGSNDKIFKYGVMSFGK